MDRFEFGVIRGYPKQRPGSVLLIWNPVTFPKRERGAKDKVHSVIPLQCQLEIVILRSPFSAVKRQYKWLLLFSLVFQ